MTEVEYDSLRNAAMHATKENLPSILERLGRYHGYKVLTLSALATINAMKKTDKLARDTKNRVINSLGEELNDLQGIPHRFINFKEIFFDQPYKHSNFGMVPGEWMWVVKEIGKHLEDKSRIVPWDTLTLWIKFIAGEMPAGVRLRNYRTGRETDVIYDMIFRATKIVPYESVMYHVAGNIAKSLDKPSVYTKNCIFDQLRTRYGYQWTNDKIIKSIYCKGIFDYPEKDIYDMMKSGDVDDGFEMD